MGGLVESIEAPIQPQSMPAKNATLRLALELASRPNGVSSLDLHPCHLSVPSSSSRLARYADRGYLDVESGTGHAFDPYRYRITRKGLERLDELLDRERKPPPEPDFGPLLMAWGLWCC